MKKVQKTFFVENRHFQLIDLLQAKFILEHAEKQLKDVVDTNSVIIGRTTSLFTIVVAGSVALFSYSVNRWLDNYEWDELLFTSSVVCAILLLIGFVLALNFVPKTYITVGAEPKTFFTDEVFKDSNTNYRLLAIYINEIEEYQFRIEFNKVVNDRRWKYFNFALRLFSMLPFLVVIVFFLSTVIF